MKLSIWDILTGVTLLGILVMIAVFGSMLMQPPQVAAEQATAIPTIAIPTSTITNTPRPPTNTPTATPTRRVWQTATPIPTNTPFKLATFTVAPRTGGGAGGSGSASSGCIVTVQKPVDDEYMNKNESFSMLWTIQNTSSKLWRSDTIDYRWVSGDSEIGYGAKSYDLKYDVSPQGTADITASMIAPSTGGTYQSNWALYDGSELICRFFIKFQVAP